ncbi:PP2C family protein-serine/threonine phosphatase [Trueperella pyogenes]
MRTTAAAMASVSDTGCVRARNEDRLLATEHLFMVADGMGGHALGDVAAQCAVTAIDEALADLESATDTGEEQTIITLALMNAADAITRHVDGTLRTASACDGGTSAGTTVAGVFLGIDPLVFHVGDSRVYRYHGGSLTRLTRDHSLVQEMVDAGELTDEQAHLHPRKNIITRAVGTYGPPRVTFARPQLAAGDYVLACTDGLHDELTDEEMTEILRHASDVDEAVRLLRDAVLAVGGRDNVTIVLAQIGH